jgi:hypothetical protein
MKSILVLAAVLTACGSATEPGDACQRPDGVYLVTETKIDGTCGDGFATPEPVVFHGWSARLHALKGVDIPTPFTVDRCDHAEWSVTDAGATYTGEIHCASPSCDEVEGTEHVSEPGVCDGTLWIHGVRALGTRG